MITDVAVEIIETTDHVVSDKHPRPISIKTGLNLKEILIGDTEDDKESKETID